jgi:hypothetical protein
LTAGTALVDADGDVNGDGLADLLIGAYDADPNGADSGATYVVFGRNTAQTGPFPASLNLSTLDGTNGFRLSSVAAGDYSGFAWMKMPASSSTRCSSVACAG